MNRDVQATTQLLSRRSNHSKNMNQFKLPTKETKLQPLLQVSLKRIIPFLFLFNLLSFQSLAQDTLIFLNGAVKYGRVLGLESNMRIIEFQNGQKNELISLELLKTYTLNQLESNWTMKNNLTQFPSNIYTVKQMGNTRKLLDFVPGKYSIGLNFTTLFNPALINDFDFFGRTYSTNSHIETFFQIDLNPRIALRFPLRIGLKPLKTTVDNTSFDFYGNYTRELIGDIGFEPIFYFKERMVKLKWFAAPSLSMVLGKSVKRTINYEPYATTYTPVSSELCYRIGGLIGFQYWLHPHFQIEGSYGYLITNNYWEPSFSENDVLINSPYLARNLRLALVYRM